MNKDNLIPGAHKLTPEENRRGGINSGISRREKKRALEIARDILSMPVDDQDPVDVSELSSLKTASEVTTDVLTSILSKLAQKSINGDLRASKLLLEISGDYTARQETKIDMDPLVGNMRYDYKIFIGFGDRQNELTYLDESGRKIRTIYGDEADQKYYELIDQGIDVNWNPSIKVHSTDGTCVVLDDDE